MRQVVGFSHRTAYATAIGLVGFLLAVMPAATKLDPAGLMTKLLDLPVAAAGLLLPLSWRGVDLWFEPQEFGYLHFSEVMLRHLRVAIPIYVLLFYLAGVAGDGLKRIRRRREGMRPTVTESQSSR